MSRVARLVTLEGRVQGVGLRFTTKQLAREYEVAGTVRNLPDGRVELIVEGEPEEVAGFLTAIREGVLAGHIRREEMRSIDVANLRGFVILP